MIYTRLKKGDKVRITAIGAYYGKFATIVNEGPIPEINWIVSIDDEDYATGVFAEEHLEKLTGDGMDNRFKKGDRVLSKTYPELKYLVVSGVFAKPGEWWYYVEDWGEKEPMKYELPETDLILRTEDGCAIKDSGERTVFSSGAVRDMHEGKGDMLSVPWAAMLRVSRHYENGAKKYGRYNYLKGIPVSSFIDSAMRHLAKYVAGYDDEDHLAAAAFNVPGVFIEHIRRAMEEEKPDMCDLPWRDGKKQFHYDDSLNE